MQYWIRIFLALCTIKWVAFGCYRITQNNPELRRHVELDQVATNVEIQSAHTNFDCLGWQEELQKIRVFWQPSKVLPHYINISIISAEQDFFIKKTVPGNSTEVAFTVLITATREYDVFITADARLSYETTFMIQTEHPCDRISLYFMLLGICFIAIIIVISIVILMFKGKKHEKSPIFYENNVPRNNKLIVVLK